MRHSDPTKVEQLKNFWSSYKDRKSPYIGVEEAQTLTGLEWCLDDVANEIKGIITPTVRWEDLKKIEIGGSDTEMLREWCIDGTLYGFWFEVIENDIVVYFDEKPYRWFKATVSRICFELF